MALTDVAIRGFKATGKLQKKSDSLGLQLWIMPTGSKLWRFAYRFDGQQKTLSIGPYGEIGLAEARKQRDEARALLVSGKDPASEKRLEKLTRAVTNATTFQAVAEEYLDRQRLEGRAPATLEKTAWLLSIAYPALGNRPITEISPPEVLAVLKSVEARGKLETARRLRATIGTVFKHAAGTGRATQNPAAILDRALLTPKVTHRAAITDPKAFGGLLRAIDGFHGQPTTRAALQLLALLFTRPGELRLAEWPEFDFDRAIWVVPAGRMKMRREHQVPLPRQAIAILQELHALTGEGKLLFPGTRSAMRPLSDGTLNAALHRLGYAKEEVTAHGFRSTASTLLNESMKFSADAIERALAHQDPDKIRGTYNRSPYWAERVTMGQWWADYLDALRKGGEILTFPKREGA